MWLEVMRIVGVQLLPSHLPILIPYKAAFGKIQIVDKAYHGGIAQLSLRSKFVEGNVASNGGRGGNVNTQYIGCLLTILMI